MNENALLSFEILSNLAVLFFTRKKTLQTPLVLLFLHLIFTKMYLGRFNTSIYFYLIPQYLLLFYRYFYTKEYVFDQSRLKPLFVWVGFMTFACAFHWFTWNSLPISFLKLQAMSLWILPFLMTSYREPQEQPFINEFTILGTRLFKISTLLLLPQSLLFYIQTDGLSLGRYILQLPMNSSAIKSGLLIPTEIINNEAYNCFFCMKDVGGIYYILLMACFMSTLPIVHIKKPLRSLFWLLSSFILIFLNQYFIQTILFHSLLLFTSYEMLRPKFTSLINIRLSTIKLIIVLALNLTLLTLSSLNPASQRRILESISSKYALLFFNNATRLNHALGTIYFSSFANRYTGLDARLLDSKLSPEQQKQSRLNRIKESLRLTYKKFPFTGAGDRTTVINEHTQYEFTYSNHSFMIDLIATFGFPVGILLLFLLFLTQYRRHLSMQFLDLESIYVSSTIILLSLGSLFGIQPLQFGFIAFANLKLATK